MAIIRPHAVALAALAPGALANLLINNWCPDNVNVVYSHAGGCDSGEDGACVTDGSLPYTIAPGTGESILTLNYIVDGVGTSVKISRDTVEDGFLQFEYNVVEDDGLYWDLSDLDGEGAGLVGTPFGDDNVKVTPTGNGYDEGTCKTIRCEAGQVCVDSYQEPDDENTRTCPVDTGDMWLDLCEPYDLFIGDGGDGPNATATSRHHSRRADLGIHHRHRAMHHQRRFRPQS